MIFWAIVAFCILEVSILMKVGAVLGVLNTWLLLFASGMVGSLLVRIQGFLLLQKIQKELDRNLMPSAQMMDGLLVFAAGVLFIWPGFVSDLMGFLLLFPLTRHLIRWIIQKQFKKAMTTGRPIHILTTRRMSAREGEDDVIDI